MKLDLRDWLDQIDSLGKLRIVKGVDWDEEIGAIADLNSKKNKYTLLFDEVKDSPKGFRLLTGALGDASRFAVTLGEPATLTDLDLVQLLKDRLTAGSVTPTDFSPRRLETAPLFENVMKGDDIDLLKFPTPKWFEHDGGRYLGTGDAVITRDPESGWENVGSYRMMIQDKGTLSLFLEGPRHARFMIQKYWDRGEPAPIAVSFGHHPLLQLVAGIEVPAGISEYEYAGTFTNSPYETVEGPVTGLSLPADSELAIEGYVYEETSTEGPFGEFLGYYASGETHSPTVRVEAIYHRDSPIILGACVGKPPHDSAYFRCPLRAALIWDVLEKSGVEGVQGVWSHVVGYSRAFVVVSIKQMFAGHARMAGHIACQCKPGAGTGRYVVVVDDDIDPSNLEAVIWALCTRSDPSSDIDKITASLGTPLDPIAPEEPGTHMLEYTSARAIIFAVKPFSQLRQGRFPKVVEANPEVQNRILKKWKEIL
ncbi:MAG: UbiD family decarboxylase [Acidobacteriota bacterium]